MELAQFEQYVFTAHLIVSPTSITRCPAWTGIPRDSSSSSIRRTRRSRIPSSQRRSRARRTESDHVPRNGPRRFQDRARKCRENQRRARAIDEYLQINPHLIVAALPPQCSRKHSGIRRSGKLTDASQCATRNWIPRPFLDDVRVGVTDTKQNDMLRPCVHSITRS